VLARLRRYATQRLLRGAIKLFIAQYILSLWSSSAMDIWESILYAFIVFSVSVYKRLEKIVLYFIYPYLKYHMRVKFGIGKITLNGKNPWDIQIHNDREFYIRVSNNPSLGLGETYMEGHWDAEKLDDVLYHIFKYEVYKEYLNIVNRSVNYLLFHVCNLQTKVRVWEVGEKHYDKGKNINSFQYRFSKL